MQVEADMAEKLGQTMETNRDIKWAVYREVSYVSSSQLLGCRAELSCMS
jgi:hypothetical protein